MTHSIGSAATFKSVVALSLCFGFAVSQAVYPKAQITTLQTLPDQRAVLPNRPEVTTSDDEYRNDDGERVKSKTPWLRMPASWRAPSLDALPV